MTHINSTVPSLERYRQMCYTKKYFVIPFLSLHLWLFLLSLSFSSFFLHLTSSSQFSPLFPFFLLLLLSFSRTSTSPFFLLFFPPFFFSITFSTLSLSFFFLSLSLGCCHWDRPSPWSSSSPMRPSPWRSLILIFFFFSCGFHVIVIMGELVLFQAFFFGIVLCWF